MNVQTLLARYQRENQTNIDAANRILTQARAEGRSNLTDREGESVATYQRQAQKARDNFDQVRAIELEEARSDASMADNRPTGAHGASRDTSSQPVAWRNTEGENAAVDRSQAFASHPVVQREISQTAERDRHIVGMHGDFGQLVRAMSTTSGSAIVPTVWSADIVDKVRNASVCYEAGAVTVPMPAKMYQLGRLVTDPTATFKTEGSPITASDPSFDYITLNATSLSAIIVSSREFLQDAPNAGEVMSNALAKVMALEVDKAALFGQLGATGTNDEGAAYGLAAPYPKGLLKNLLDNAPGQVLGFAANGTAQTAATPWNEMLALYYAVKTNNEQPGAFVSSDRLVQAYDGMYNTLNDPIRRHDRVDSIPWLTSNVVPSFTRGTMTSTATDVFCGDFSQMLIGQRLGIELRTLNERYAESGSVAIMAYFRGDVAIARPKAFAAYRALKGA